MSQRLRMHRWLPLTVLLVLLIAFRVLGSVFPSQLPNFQPLAALFFCGALLVNGNGWRGFSIALAIWLVTYPLPIFLQGKAEYGSPAIFLTTFTGFVLTYLLGTSLSTRSAGYLLAGSVLAAVIFHLVTNGSAWIGDPRYAKTLTGLWQSLWTGLPMDGMPSWVFLRNLLGANFLFTAIFLTSRLALPKPAFVAKVLRTAH